jgi:hypothetical protein
LTELTVIDGEGDGMAVTPQLVKNEQGQICMQIMHKGYNATLPLPDELAGKTAEELRDFFEIVVPDLMKGLVAHVAAEQRKQRRRAKGRLCKV